MNALSFYVHDHVSLHGFISPIYSTCDGALIVLLHDLYVPVRAMAL
uniref:Uncharacterized protein n=1 Tax=Arundo donax TaxID=35708 RepID=A0A0A9AFC2_ARUDO